jgi:hypothetical protein
VTKTADTPGGRRKHHVFFSKIAGLARSTINRGEDDLDAEPLAKGRVRRTGGGCRAVSETDSGLVPALKRLVDPAHREMCRSVAISALLCRSTWVIEQVIAYGLIGFSRRRVSLKNDVKSG